MEFFQDNLSVSQRTSYLEQACGLLCEGTRTLLAFLSRGGWGGGELRNVVLDSPKYNVLPTPHAHDRVPLQIFAPSVQTVRERGNRCLRVVPLPFLRVVGRKRKGRGFKPPWLSHAAWAGCFTCFIHLSHAPTSYVIQSTYNLRSRPSRPLHIFSASKTNQSHAHGSNYSLWSVLPNATKQDTETNITKTGQGGGT